MKRTYPKILKCNEFSSLLAGFVQTEILFVFPYLTFSPLTPLSIKETDYTHGNAICDSSKLYTNITFTFDEEEHRAAPSSNKFRKLTESYTLVKKFVLFT